MTQPLLPSPIAIVGMACRLPGAAGLDEYWQLLRNGRDAITELPPDRLDRDLYFHAEKGRRGRTYSTLGGLVPERPLTRTAELLSSADLAKSDSCHRLLCEVAIEACEHAGFDTRNLAGGNAGVYIGHSAGSPLGGDLAFGTLAEETLDYLRDVPAINQYDPAAVKASLARVTSRLRARRPRQSMQSGPDVESNFAAALIAKALRLTGPHFVIDAACASSLVALSAAALALSHGQIDMAIAGGASYNKGDSLILFSHAQSCSAQGSRPFDQQADGLISSEGYVVFVMKLLTKAIADGDTVHAVIRGLGVSSDGRGRSLWAPRREGQFAAVERAYAGGLDPRRVQFIEAHATSTQVGDATELEALAAYFGPLHSQAARKIPIGSVKSNIGHTLETAGVAGLLKAVLAMKHGEIPPTIHLEQLNRSVPWPEIPFYVPTTVQPWPSPTDGEPRCAAVNAFGIGGLNVHVVVEEYRAEACGRQLVATPARPVVGRTGGHTGGQGESRPWPAVAIIGRGAVLPRARSVAEFTALLRAGQSAISAAPSTRWRNQIGVRPLPVQPWSSPTSRGGFITDYEYDWKKHKVPPKQVAQANPLQFMLLDAAREALSESGYDTKTFDQAHTAVVVGSIFGGEFGNHLQVGLRLPEVRRELLSELQQLGLSGPPAERLLDEFERILLQAKPALLDETGSFTSSTLASRIAKTLNLMGGALALDAGDCSSFAALSLACDLLRSGACSMVFCAAAQRAMDLSSFETLAMHGRLADEHGNGYLPGEGVVVLLLKRLDLAQQDGDRILGVINQVAAATDSRQLDHAIELASQRLTSAECANFGAVQRVESGCGVRDLDDAEMLGIRRAHPQGGPANPVRLTEIIGHTQATHGLALLLRSTIVAPHVPTQISTHSSNGLSYQVLMDMPQDRSRPAPSPATAGLRGGLEAGETAAPPNGSPLRILRMAAESEDELRALLLAAKGREQQLWSNGSSAEGRDHRAFRLAVVANSVEQLAAKITLASQSPSLIGSAATLGEQGVYCHRRNGALRSAFLFSGQGSQYPGMLRELVETCSAAQIALMEANEAMRQLGFPSFPELAWEDTGRLGTDLWTTQIAVLLADHIAFAAAREYGFEPDCVAGHSFGEFAALLAAGSISLAQAIQLTTARVQAIAAAVHEPYVMLSIDASPEAVQSWLADYRAEVYLSHWNAPEQTVVGGRPDAMDRLESALSAKSVTCRRLKVPTAFHTPLMEPTLVPWRAALARENFLPPRIPLLSSVTNRWVADPDDIRENLLRQMVTPVRYVELVQRLAREGVQVFLEIGPQQVLTRLHRRILGTADYVICGLDHPKRTAAEQRCRIQAELETAGWEPPEAATVVPGYAAPAAVSPPAVLHFDATVNRKHRRRNESRPPTPAVQRGTLEEFDATHVRRGRNRVAVDRPVETSTPPTIEASFPPAELRPNTTPAAASVKSTAPATSATSALDEVDKILIDFVMEHTGYPADLINFDWDLEADLGIDSIKRAQLFGEMREIFALETSERGSLDDYRTLRQIADLIRSKTTAVPSPGTAARESMADPQPPIETELPGASLPTASPTNRQELVAATAISTAISTGVSARDSESFLIDFVIEQTGYPPELIDLDADLEADLGIDSIKKAQLFGELREQFHLSLDDGDRSVLAQYRTLRQILSLLPTGSPPAAQFEATPAVTSPAVTSPAVASPVTSRNGSRRNLPTAGYGPRYVIGLERGRIHADRIRRLLRDAADSHYSDPDLQPGNGHVRAWTDDELSEFQGLADGAGVLLEGILAFQHRPLGATDDEGVLRLASDLTESQAAGIASTSPGSRRVGSAWQRLEAAEAGVAAYAAPGQETVQPSPTTEKLGPMPLPKVTDRYVLRMAAAAQRDGAAERRPVWSGGAVIFGNNEIGLAIRERLARDGQRAFIVTPSSDPEQATRELDEIWDREPVPHLFLVTPRDEAAASGWNWEDFLRRQQVGVAGPFWFCQRWMKRAVAAGKMDGASIVGVTSLGGDFGFSCQVPAVESGAVTGLLKAMIIESWVNGFRTIPIKLIDARPDEPAAQVVESIWRELGSPSYDVEIGWHAGQRSVVRATRRPLDECARVPFQRGGVWVCTGGGRGITAHVARELASRYDLRLHLIGMSPAPQIPDSWQSLGEVELRRLKLDTMQSAREAGENPIKAWEKVEKAQEIDRTLREMRQGGIVATYHSCDVADRSALARVLERIRRDDGPIEGILHGAGIGKDARFERKEPKRVAECIRAKVDGGRALMELTRGDPLRYFVAFGSISGRFGANGHTDYSLANDMLAKLVDWYRHERPEVKSVAFHWHAWGDVGMATKPETRLALEMVGMQFMPAEEGVRHLVRELETAEPEAEVLITDDRYYRLFYPAETLDAADESGGTPRLSLLAGATPVSDVDREGNLRSVECRTKSQAVALELDPTREPFLVEHRLDDRPLLPYVIGIELLAEAALQRLGSGQVAALREVTAVQALRWFTDRPLTIRLHTSTLDSTSVACELTADFLSRDGRLVEADRTHFRARVDIADAVRLGSARSRTPAPRSGWEAVQYPPRGEKMYLGPPFRCLKRVVVEGDRAWGQIIAPALVELAGPHRDIGGWVIPSAALDSCLFATGILCWRRVRAGATLPVSFGAIELGRTPQRGESCEVEILYRRQVDGQAVFDFSLFGDDGSELLRVSDYHVAWISG